MIQDEKYLEAIKHMKKAYPNNNWMFQELQIDRPSKSYSQIVKEGGVLSDAQKLDVKRQIMVSSQAEYKRYKELYGF